MTEVMRPPAYSHSQTLNHRRNCTPASGCGDFMLYFYLRSLFSVFLEIFTFCVNTARSLIH